MLLASIDRIRVARGYLLHVSIIGTLWENLRCSATGNIAMYTYSRPSLLL